MTGTWYSLEVRPKVPKELSRLEELASDLFYSWSTQVRAVFYYLHPELWGRCGHNPKLFLRRVSQRRLDRALHDPTFMENYSLALADYDNYLRESLETRVKEWLSPKEDLVAYFSAEFGFHESVPIYSGGLGILAGDHCKAASDLNVPLIAVGLLYRQGYFTQTIDGYGNQEAQFTDSNFAHLPIETVVDEKGREVHVSIDLPGRVVTLRIWRAKAGRIRLYLLDSDVPENTPEDRTITYQLYGGDANTRILQEIVLGIGGVRALRVLGYPPTVWHINEGHAAFQIIERCREHVAAGMRFDAARELVAASTVFTTHTPVPAGHDIFSHDLVMHYFTDLVSVLDITAEQFLELGSSPVGQGGFNMTALALRGSRFHNGVSRIHGGVAAEMEGYVWPQVPHAENAIGYVTNGVHVSTFLAPEWRNLFNLEFGHEWRNRLLDEGYWERIDRIADFNFWSVRQRLKSVLLSDARSRAVRQHERNGYSALEIARMIRWLDPANADVLVLGFARRFATYKRAMLLFNDLDRLARMLNDPDRPVIIVFAGKAHPNDLPGQQLIHSIHQISRRKEFEGKIVLLEDYNLAMARRLVTGVDVWVNTPEYPLEASGTSGQKAGMNGVINLSVLDGWWGEGYNGENGWAIMPHPTHDAAARDQIEGQALLDILEHEVIPQYFDRNGHGYSAAWVKMSKASMKSILPRYNAQRMVTDYVRDYYGLAKRQGAALSVEDGKPASELARWKKKVDAAWHEVRVRRVDEPAGEIEAGDKLPIVVAARLNALAPDDVVVECIVGRRAENGELIPHEKLILDPQGENKDGEELFRLDLLPSLAGLQYYKLRMYPHHALLSHPYETGHMLWV